MPTNVLEKNVLEKKVLEKNILEKNDIPLNTLFKPKFTLINSDKKIEYHQIIHLEQMLYDSLYNLSGISMPQGAWKTTPIPPQWQKIISLCDEILLTQCTSLQVFFIRLQAQIAYQSMLQSLSNKKQIIVYSLNDFTFLNSLKENILETNNFIEMIRKYNLESDEDIQYHLDKSDIEISNLLKNLSLLSDYAYSLNDISRAKNIEQKSLRADKPKDFINKEITYEKQLMFFEKHKQPLSLESQKTLIYILEHSYGANIADTLEKVLNLLALDPIIENIQTNEIPEQNTTNANITNIQTNIQSREQAYKHLKIVADFLIKNEPHAFTGYILNKLASLEKKPLSEIFDEIPNISSYLK